MKESVAEKKKDLGKIITLCDDMLTLRFPEDFYELGSEELMRKFSYRKIPTFSGLFKNHEQLLTRVDLGQKPNLQIDFLPQSVKDSGNASFASMPSDSIGRAYIPATWEVYYPDGLLKSYN